MPCPDATNRAGFPFEVRTVYGRAWMDASEFGLTRLCRKLSLRIQAPAVSDRTMAGGENPRPFRTGQAGPDLFSFISFRQIYRSCEDLSIAKVSI